MLDRHGHLEIHVGSPRAFGESVLDRHGHLEDQCWIATGIGKFHFESMRIISEDTEPAQVAKRRNQNDVARFQPRGQTSLNYNPHVRI